MAAVTVVPVTRALASCRRGTAKAMGAGVGRLADWCPVVRGVVVYQSCANSLAMSGGIVKTDGNLTNVFRRGIQNKMPRGSKITATDEARIIARLQHRPHASFVASKTGFSFATVWRVAERAGIELTAGREAKGYKRLAPEQREKVIEARRTDPAAPQMEIARQAGVSRSTVWRIERGRRGASGFKLG
jgi:hypothetical protein